MLCRLAEDACSQLHLRPVHVLRKSHTEATESLVSVTTNYTAVKVDRQATHCFTCVFIWLLIGLARVSLSLRSSNFGRYECDAHSDCQRD